MAWTDAARIASAAARRAKGKTGLRKGGANLSHRGSKKTFPTATTGYAKLKSNKPAAYGVRVSARTGQGYRKVGNAVGVKAPFSAGGVVKGKGKTGWKKPSQMGAPLIRTKNKVKMNKTFDSPKAMERARKANKGAMLRRRAKRRKG